MKHLWFILQESHIVEETSNISQTKSNINKENSVN